MGSSGSAVTDYDLHGFVRVRVVGTTADAGLVGRQLGLPAVAAAGQADITVRFVDRLELHGPLRAVGPTAGFTDDAFLLLRGARKSRVRVKMPLADVGGRCEIVCERGLDTIPLLLAIVNLTALAHDALPVHASAFTYRGHGVLVTGWSKGGKSETLLAFASEGASYIGDEWVYVVSDGEELRGIPEPMRLWSWQLNQLPGYRTAVPPASRLRLRALDLAVAALGSADRGRRRQLATLLEQQTNVRVEPQRLFRNASTAPHGRCDTIVHAVASHSPAISVEQADPADIAARVVHSLEEERAGLLAAYRHFRYAFPHRPNPLLEEAAVRERKLLEAAFANRRAFQLTHPHPVEIPALYNALAPVLA